MWFIGVEVEQETSAPPPKKNPGSAPVWELDLPIGQARISIFVVFRVLDFLLYPQNVFFFLTESKKDTTSRERRKNKQTQEKTKQNKTFDNNCPQSKAKTNNVSLGSEEKLYLLTLLIYKKPSQL